MYALGLSVQCWVTILLVRVMVNVAYGHVLRISEHFTHVSLSSLWEWGLIIIIRVL